MRVILADKQKYVVSALQFFLWTHYRDWEFFAATSLPELFQILALHCPDLLMIDWGMQALFDIDPNRYQSMENVISAIHQHCPRLYMIVLDINPETEGLAMQLGANAFICKSDPPETLLLVIQQFTR